jgi:hypothetical protein
MAFGAQTNQRLIAQAIENMIDIAASTQIAWSIAWSVIAQFLADVCRIGICN